MFPLFLWKVFKKKSGSTLFSIQPENEQFIYTNKNTPLEKETKGFYGQKEFSLPDDNVHVITLFIESFRGKNIGVFGANESITPCFDQLSKEGILFTNFHSNGTQTFKALFHLLFGLPAYYGSDFQTNSKRLKNLNLKGLPDFFLKKGYDPIFIQGGNNSFDGQGDFLKNHGYKQIIDCEDIKKLNPLAKGTSWGVDDEYLYEHILTVLKESKNPLFLNAATITNHHPFRVPVGYKAPLTQKTNCPMTDRFIQTMQYSDNALGKFVSDLKNLDIPVHLYIMGDHGVDIGDLKTLKQSIKRDVTHVPLLIFPITKQPFKPKVISDPASHIDLLPTMMDLYGFSGKNSSTGSSLVRKRSFPHALVFNQIVKPSLLGEITASGLNLDKNKENFDTLEHLFRTRAICSKELDGLRSYDFSSETITVEQLEDFLLKHNKLTSLIINNCMFIHCLELSFPATLRHFEVDNNLFITDFDVTHIPCTVERLSLINCPNLTDATLTFLATLPLKHLHLSGKNYTKEGLETLALFLNKLECICFEDGKNITSQFFNNLPSKNLKDVRIKGSSLVENSFLAEISSHPIRVLLLSNCSNITDCGVSFLKDTHLDCLFLENAPKITDRGITALQKVPFQTFSISHAPKITINSIKTLNPLTLQGIYCIGCELDESVEEKEFEGNVRAHYFLNESSLITTLKMEAFTKSSKNIFFSS